MRTSRAFSSHVDITDTGIRVRVSRKLGNERLRNYTLLECIEIRTLHLPLPKSSTWCNVVNVLLDMARHMVFFSCDILHARGVLPDKVISKQKVFNFGRSCIKLNPLSRRLDSGIGKNRPTQNIPAYWQIS